MSSYADKAKGVSIVICGAAGQGIKTIEEFLVHALKRSDYHVFASREYMSRVRGGNNSTEIRVAPDEVNAFVDRIDILIALSPGIRANVMKRITEETLIVGEKDSLGDEFKDKGAKFYDARFVKEAEDVGGRIYANSVAAGVVFGLLEVKTEIISDMFNDFFSSKGEDVVNNNIEASGRGISLGEKIRSDGVFDRRIETSDSLKDRIAMDGSEAVSLGAIAGGCNFIASYPMSPATGVLTFLAANARKFDIVAEQIEDEIAAINTAVGASYAGARPMVSTSGGGLDLMSEGLSLAGVMETPVVVHVGQRPGPATGMATRTEQSDLNIAIHCGHGETPRIVLAPGTIEDGFYMMQRAFNLADKHQVPVIFLTDQYYLNTFYDIEPLEMERESNEYHIVESDKDYRRYEVTDSGLSPRSVPGYGQGIVNADSHEHDPWGRAQEDFELRKRMVQKRLRKEQGIIEDILKPYFDGPDDYSNLVISWGSTYPMIREALEIMGRSDTAHLHLRQVYPVDVDSMKEYMEKADRLICVEGNATAQLASLLRTHTGIEIDDRVLNYSGLQFSVEEICEGLSSVIEGKEE